MENERTSLMLTVHAISTITFFKGEIKKVSVFLKSRVNDIIQKNPWLAGSLRQKIKLNNFDFTTQISENTHNQNDDICVHYKENNDGSKYFFELQDYELKKDMDY